MVKRGKLERPVTLIWLVDAELFKLEGEEVFVVSRLL
jgi:hypothetical protein